MAEKMCPGPLSGSAGFREAVCVHTNKVYDQCKSKECIRDLRVYLPAEDQCLIESSAVTVKPREAELLTVVTDVERIQFNRGFYSVDIRFFYKITVEACTSVGRPRILEGLSVFDKRCILFGSEGGARIFSSKFVPNGGDVQLPCRSNLPTAVVEAVDPIILDTRVVYPQCNCPCPCNLLREVPRAICGCFGGQDLVLETEGNQLVVTLGQFSIIRLERDIQLLMPAFDICMPDKECCDSGIGGDHAEDPCEIFSRFDFPVDAFFPPRKTCRDNFQTGCTSGCGSTNSQSGGCHSGCSGTSGGCNTGCGSTGATGGCGCNTGCGSTGTSGGCNSGCSSRR